MTDHAIAVLPYGMGLGPKLAHTAASDLIWPLGMPDRLQGRKVGDLRPDDHLIVFPKTATHFRLRRGTRARISLILGEPAVIHAKHHRLLRLTHRRFHRILTFNQDLLDLLPNARFVPYGTTWVPEWRDVQTEKTSMCSLIASAKRDSNGHQLRHAMVDWVRETDQPVEIMGRGYKPFEAKSDGLAPYRYSIVIENVEEKNYFSEKLVDAVLCNTVPIYWGCPNLEDFVETSAIIRCNSAEDIKTAVASMSNADYERRLPDLKAIQETIAGFCDLEKRAAEVIRNEA